MSAVLKTLGVIVLLHAIYSANHYKSMAMELGTSTTPPLDVIVECGMSFLFILVGYLWPISLSPVTVSVDTTYKSLDEFRNRPEMISFGSRARYLNGRLKS